MKADGEKSLNLEICLHFFFLKTLWFLCLLDTPEDISARLCTDELYCTILLNLFLKMCISVSKKIAH